MNKILTLVGVYRDYTIICKDNHIIPINKPIYGFPPPTNKELYFFLIKEENAYRIVRWIEVK